MSSHLRCLVLAAVSLCLLACANALDVAFQLQHDLGQGFVDAGSVKASLDTGKVGSDIKPCNQKHLRLVPEQAHGKVKLTQLGATTFCIPARCSTVSDT
jgi:hypothetical protein